jgi:hypothetical protein
MTVPSPLGWTPQTAIAARFPQIAGLRRRMQDEIRGIAAQCDREEARGTDTSCLRQTLRELRWRLEYTADAGAIHKTLDRLRATAARSAPRTVRMPDANDSYGLATDVWFLKLEASVDDMLDPDSDDKARPPRFLDRLNDPARLRAYLESLLVSRPAEDGIDRRKELNLATANLVRLILWRRPPNYPWHPGLEAVIRRFIAEWQDPITGFFGAHYQIGGRRTRTVDLSLTFHMARYLGGKIGYWPQVIDTLIGIRGERYPNGWLDEVGLTSHNNYDVAILFQLGWQRMRADQRRRGEQELTRLLDWCVTTAIAPDGEIVARAVGESLPESYYFTIAFLDAVGYFDRAKRFWSEREFPDAPAVRTRLEHRLLTLPQRDPMVRMARERLRRADR